MLDQPTQYPPSTSPSVAPPEPEPMQVDTFHLSNAERQQRIFRQLYLYYGAEGHLLPACPVRQPCSVVSTIQIPTSITLLTRTDVIVMASRYSVSAKALTDPGSAGNFISLDFLRKLYLQERPCSQVQNIATFNIAPQL